jgi:N6-L-threonylcarbamoyladenine synthase
MVGLLGYKQWQEKKYADLNTEAYARAVFKKLSIP